MTQNEIYQEIGKLLVQKAKLINQTNAQVAEIDRRMNDLAILAEKENGQ